MHNPEFPPPGIPLMPLPDAATLRDWLLQRLDPATALALEQRLLTEDAIAMLLREAETDLLDDYAHERLDPATRSAVELRLLATAHDRQRLRVARALAQHAATGSHAHAAVDVIPRAAAARVVPLPPAPAWRGHWLVPAALAAGIAVAAVLLPWRAPPPAGQGEASVSEALPSLTLLASASRGADAVLPALPSGATAVLLQAEVESTQAQYELSISDADKTVFSARGLTAQVSAPYVFVEARVPLALLSGGPYQIRVAPQDDAAAAQTWRVKQAPATR